MHNPAPLWTPISRVPSQPDFSAAPSHDGSAEGVVLGQRKYDDGCCTARTTGAMRLNAFVKSPLRLSPLPLKETVSSWNGSLEQGGNDDSLHGVSTTTGFALATERTSPATLNSSISDVRASPVPSRVSPAVCAQLRYSSVSTTEACLPLAHTSAGSIAFSSTTCCGATSVQTGCASTQGTRRSMEDRHKVEARAGCTFLGVYDGHGGAQCAEFLEDNLHRHFFRCLEDGMDVEAALLDAIVQADAVFVAGQSQTWASEPAGSCCAVAVLNDTHLVVGNVGDSEVVRCRGGVAEVLSVRHTPRGNAEEKCRVEQAGGRVVGARVRHPAHGAAVSSIALSRSLGDAGFKLPIYTGGKASGVIGDPYVHTFERTALDEFLVIGCDGLWDAVSHNDVVKLCRDLIAEGAQRDDSGASLATTVADALVNTALEEGSSDNITVIVALLADRVP